MKTRQQKTLVVWRDFLRRVEYPLELDFPGILARRDFAMRKKGYLLLVILALMPGLWLGSTRAKANRLPAAFPNGGFEQDVNSDNKPDSWDWPSSNWVWDGSVAHGGSRSAKISRFSGGATAYLWSPQLSAQPSTNYALTFWLKTQNATNRPRMVLFQYNNSGVQVEDRTVMYVDVDGATGWQKITYRFQTTAQTGYVLLRLHLNSGVSGTFWFDDFDMVSDGAALYPLKSGFPVEIDHWVETSSPVVADINNDGHNEILAADYSGQISAWDESGVMLAGFPVNAGGPVYGHLAVGNLDAQADLEIVAGVGSTAPGAEGKVSIWKADGSMLAGWPQAVARRGTDRYSKIFTVALADVDGDSSLEVIAGTNNNHLGSADPNEYVPNLYVWYQDGRLANDNGGIWPIDDEFNTAILGTLAVGDLTGNGSVDIAVTRDYHRVFAFDNQGHDLAGWPLTTYQPENGVWNGDPYIVHRYSAPTLADLDHDGTVEYIVAGQRRPFDSPTIYNVDLLVFQPDGTRKSGWATPAGGVGALDADLWMQQATAVADLNGDGRLDIVWPAQDGWLYVYAADKTLLWSFDYAQGNVVYASEPVIGDVDGDGLPEVVFGTYDLFYGAADPVGIWILEHDGSVKAGAPLRVGTPGMAGAPALADVNGDGQLDIVAVTRVGYVYVWETGAAYREALLPWPVARHDFQRTAFVSTEASSLASSQKSASTTVAAQGEVVTYTIRLLRTGPPVTTTVYLTDTLPAGVSLVPGSLTNSTGSATFVAPSSTVQWSGELSTTATVDITYAVNIDTAVTQVVENNAVVTAVGVSPVQLSQRILVNALHLFLPIIQK